MANLLIKKAEPPAIEPGPAIYPHLFPSSSGFSRQPWLLLLHANTALSSIFDASPSRVKEEALAVKPTLSHEWQEDEIRKYLAEPLSFPQPTIPLGYSKPDFLINRSNPQELQHQPPPHVLVSVVDHTSEAPLPSNGLRTSSGVLSSGDVPTCKSDRTTCDPTCSDGVTSVGDLSSTSGLTPQAQLAPDHNHFSRKRKGHESVLEAKSYLAPTRKQMKVPKDNQKKVLHVDHAENLPESTQSSQSKGRKAGVDPKDTKHLVVEILVNLSDTEIQIENFPLSNEIMKQRKSELEAWKSENGTGAGDAHTRFRILKFVKNVTKMSTFLIISHASLLNEKMAKEITQGNVENVLKFMKDFWEKSYRKEPLISLRPYNRLPQISNILDPNDTHTHKKGHRGKMLWYGACEEISILSYIMDGPSLVCYGQRKEKRAVTGQSPRDTRTASSMALEAGGSRAHCPALAGFVVEYDTILQQAQWSCSAEIQRKPIVPDKRAEVHDMSG
ncbi:hypothetical protein PSTT_02435 [Puccinia striiformis]|uniref:Uncharacterized protein n=1 Tax=Puccinia striiformis TaxID=27350 RepID=A0A2S4W023_9BASI|nr:hypothetical protein PSTT_02435 [Puccinia striiformis]